MSVVRRQFEHAPQQRFRFGKARLLLHAQRELVKRHRIARHHAHGLAQQPFGFVEVVALLHGGRAPDERVGVFGVPREQQRRGGVDQRPVAHDERRLRNRVKQRGIAGGIELISAHQRRKRLALLVPCYARPSAASVCPNASQSAAPACGAATRARSCAELGVCRLGVFGRSWRRFDRSAGCTVRRRAESAL